MDTWDPQSCQHVQSTISVGSTQSHAPSKAMRKQLAADHGSSTQTSQ